MVVDPRLSSGACSQPHSCSSGQRRVGIVAVLFTLGTTAWISSCDLNVAKCSSLWQRDRLLARESLLQHVRFVLDSGPLGYFVADGNLNRSLDEINAHMRVHSRALQQAAAFEVTFLTSSDIFSLRDLPCTVRETQLAMMTNRQFHGGRVAAFAYHRTQGTSVLRSQMLAEAVAQLPGWDAIILHSGVPQRALPENVHVEFCILNKELTDLFLEWCQRNARAIYWDFLDNFNVIAKFHKQRGHHLPINPLVDVVLTTSYSLAHEIRVGGEPHGKRAGWPSAWPLYHHHSNVGYVAPLERLSLPFVCRVVVFSSSHGPSWAQAQQLRSMACLASSVWEAAIVYVKSSRHSMESLRCPNRPPEMTAACVAMDQELARRRAAEQALNVSCFTPQIRFHADPYLHMGDVVLIVPRKSDYYAKFGTTTRLLHWLSHGIPAVFWAFDSYVELAEAGDYRLPSSQAIPVVGNMSNFLSNTTLKAVLEELGDGAARLTLRRQGLLIASNYSVVGVAKRLIELHESGNTFVDRKDYGPESAFKKQPRPTPEPS